jgi:hypothetical protein
VSGPSFVKCLRVLVPTIYRGGYRAAQYAATFPYRVGNFVLDAAAPHGRVSRFHGDSIKAPH